MKYLVISRHKQSILAKMRPEQLPEAKAKLQDAMDRGVIEGCYSFVGGGSVWIVNVADNATLARGLRKLGISGVEVHAIVDGLDVVDGYIAHHQQNQG